MTSEFPPTAFYCVSASQVPCDFCSPCVVRDLTRLGRYLYWSNYRSWSVLAPTQAVQPENSLFVFLWCYPIHKRGPTCPVPECSFQPRTRAQQQWDACAFVRACWLSHHCPLAHPQYQQVHDRFLLQPYPGPRRVWRHRAVPALLKWYLLADLNLNPPESCCEDARCAVFCSTGPELSLIHI